MNLQFFSSVNDLQQSEAGGSFGGFEGNTQSQLHSQGVSTGGGVTGDYADDAQTAGVDQYSPSNSFGSMVDIQSQQTYSIGDLNQLSQLQQQPTSNQEYQSTSFQPTSSTGGNNYYSSCGDNMNYTSQYQQTSNSNANIGSTNSKMRNSFTNSSAIYNVNNYIGR